MNSLELRTVELYVNYTGALDDDEVRRKISTNAPDEIITKICEDVKQDGIFKRGKAIDGIVNVIKARGFICEYINIPRFGFSEKSI